MDAGVIVGIINLFFAGLLAGEEFVIRYGVRGPLASLEQQTHIQLRQSLIRTLRILVPIIFGLAILSGIAAIILNGFDNGFGLRCAGLLALVTFITVTLTGTVPINEAALAWNPSAPPENWRALINRWEQLDTVRTWLAIVAFALFSVSMSLR